jgi:hypothetical protein
MCKRNLRPLLIILPAMSLLIMGYTLYIEAPNTFPFGGYTYNNTAEQDPTTHIDPDGPYIHQPNPIINYRINSAGTPDISGTDEFTGIHDSFTSWENASLLGISDFPYGGTTTQTLNNDGTQNVIFWGKRHCIWQFKSCSYFNYL